MVSRFATVLKDKILADNEAVAPANTRKRQNLACWCLLVGRKHFLIEFATKS